MFKKKNTPLAMDTVLGEYTTFNGSIETEGSVKILGKVEGDIKAGGDVYVESTSTITGNVYASNVYISGHIKGNILSKGLVHLMASAKLFGDMEVNAIVTDEGAIFQGSCKMIEISKEEAAVTTQPNKKNKLKSKNSNLVD